MSQSIASKFSVMIQVIKAQYKLDARGFLAISEYNQKMADLIREIEADPFVASFYQALDIAGDKVELISFSDNSILGIHLDVPQSSMITPINCRVNYMDNTTVNGYIQQYIM